MITFEVSAIFLFLALFFSVGLCFEASGELLLVLKGGKKGTNQYLYLKKKVFTILSIDREIEYFYEFLTFYTLLTVPAVESFDCLLHL